MGSAVNLNNAIEMVGNIRFTTVPLKALSDQVLKLDIYVYNFKTDYFQFMISLQSDLRILYS